MMRRKRGGFTLIEIMIAVGLTGMLMAAVLSIVRVQLRVFEQNDQVVRAQQNERATMDFLESVLRRACGGVSSGAVALNVPGVTQSATVPCVRYWDGANISATAFTTGSVNNSDAIEVVYATGFVTSLTAAATMTTTPTLAVADVSQFSVGDFVLLPDSQYVSAYLFKVTAVTASGAGVPTPGTLSLGTLSSAPIAPTLSTPSTAVNAPVLKAATLSMYVVPSTDTTGYANMLVVDPSGIGSTQHTNYGGTVQPLVEGVVDMQIAIGLDTNQDGTVTESTGSPSTDEWVGNASGETLGAPQWNGAAGTPQPRQIRVSLTVKTLTTYSTAQAPLTAYEDRPAASYPAATAGTAAPKYRQDRIVVAPRAWNLTE